jgi:hypothetical protein
MNCKFDLVRVEYRTAILTAKAFASGMYPSAVHSAELRVGEQVAIGGSHTLILKPDGTVWACGNNALGQLGLGSPSDYYFPS